MGSRLLLLLLAALFASAPIAAHAYQEERQALLSSMLVDGLAELAYCLPSPELRGLANQTLQTLLEEGWGQAAPLAAQLALNITRSFDREGSLSNCSSTAILALLLPVLHLDSSGSVVGYCEWNRSVGAKAAKELTGWMTSLVYQWIASLRKVLGELAASETVVVEDRELCWMARWVVVKTSPDSGREARIIAVYPVNPDVAALLYAAITGSPDGGLAAGVELLNQLNLLNPVYTVYAASLAASAAAYRGGLEAASQIAEAVLGELAAPSTSSHLCGVLGLCSLESCAYHAGAGSCTSILAQLYQRLLGKATDTAGPLYWLAPSITILVSFRPDMAASSARLAEGYRLLAGNTSRLARSLDEWYTPLVLYPLSLLAEAPLEAAVLASYTPWLPGGYNPAAWAAAYTAHGGIGELVERLRDAETPACRLLEGEINGSLPLHNPALSVYCSLETGDPSIAWTVYTVLVPLWGHLTVYFRGVNLTIIPPPEAGGLENLTRLLYLNPQGVASTVSTGDPVSSILDVIEALFAGNHSVPEKVFELYSRLRTSRSMSEAFSAWQELARAVRSLDENVSDPYVAAALSFIAALEARSWEQFIYNASRAIEFYQRLVESGQPESPTPTGVGEAGKSVEANMSATAAGAGGGFAETLREEEGEAPAPVAVGGGAPGEGEEVAGRLAAPVNTSLLGWLASQLSASSNPLVSRVGMVLGEEAAALEAGDLEAAYNASLELALLLSTLPRGVLDRLRSIVPGELLGELARAASLAWVGEELAVDENRLGAVMEHLTEQYAGPPQPTSSPGRESSPSTSTPGSGRVEARQSGETEEGGGASVASQLRELASILREEGFVHASTILENAAREAGEGEELSQEVLGELVAALSMAREEGARSGGGSEPVESLSRIISQAMLEKVGPLLESLSETASRLGYPTVAADASSALQALERGDLASAARRLESITETVAERPELARALGRNVRELLELTPLLEQAVGGAGSSPLQAGAPGATSADKLSIEGLEDAAEALGSGSAISLRDLLSALKSADEGLQPSSGLGLGELSSASQVVPRLHLPQPSTSMPSLARLPSSGGISGVGLPSVSSPGTSGGGLGVLGFAGVAAVLVVLALAMRSREIGVRIAARRAKRLAKQAASRAGRGGVSGAGGGVVELFAALLSLYGLLYREKKPSETHREYREALPREELPRYTGAAAVYEAAKFSSHPPGESEVEQLARLVEEVAEAATSRHRGGSGGGRGVLGSLLSRLRR